MQATHPVSGTRVVLLERALALFLILHGLAHLVGTQASLAAASLCGFGVAGYALAIDGLVALMAERRKS